MTRLDPRPRTAVCSRRRPSGRRVSIGIVCALALVASACNDDGREMREPGPDQNLSIITTTTVATTVAPGSAGGAVTFGTTIPPSDGDGMGHDGDDVGFPGFDVALPWPDGDRIPRRFTCQGAGLSPTVSWDGLPDGTVEVALVVRAPDTDDPVHWIVAGIAPEVSTVREGARLRSAVVGMNDAGETGWTAPCPDGGQSVLVRFEVRALGQQVEVQQGDPADLMLPAIEAATLATAIGSGIAVG